MSVKYNMTIPDALANRLAVQEIGSYQDITLRGLHLLAYGSPIERELRAEIERLHETIRRLAGGVSPPPPQVSNEKELGW